jgi:hypothetical protein
MGVETSRVVNVGGFTSGQRKFSDFHRNDPLEIGETAVKLVFTGA